MPKINAAGLQLIEQFEGLELTAYQDSGGVWTIGYGHTGPDVHEGLTITKTQAVALLEADLTIAEQRVVDAVEVVLTPNQFSALVSFEYNTGAPASSTIFQLINQNDMAGAASEFNAWVYDNGQVLPGLVRRRAAERALFLTPG
jgi:lysozyme